jgi:hypothetical protein
MAALGCSSANTDNQSATGGSSSGGNPASAGEAGNAGQHNLFPNNGKGGNAGDDGDSGTGQSGGDPGGNGQGGTLSNPDGGPDIFPAGSGGTSPNPDGGVDPGPDLTAPSISSVSPEDGATGVYDDAQIVIEFNEAMDTTSVEGAFNPGNLPGVDFSWNTGHTTLTITPQSLLTYAEGLDTSVVAEAYNFALDTGATDVAGNPLPTASFDFTTLRRIATLLSGDSSLDGFAQADGLDDHSYDEELVVGSSDDVKITGFLSFSISSLPTGIAEIENAQVNVTQTTTYASYGAYDDLGSLYLEHVTFSAVDSTAVTATALRSLGVIATTPANEVKHRTVTVALNEDYAQRVSRSNRTQYRLAFQNVGAADGGYVVTGFTTAEAATNAPELEVTYLLP